MADGARRGRSRPKKPRGPLEEMSLKTYVLSQTYLLMAVTGLGFLAFTWSTVVLLGGFATALHRKDFWCLTVISMIQVARRAHKRGRCRRCPHPAPPTGLTHCPAGGAITVHLLWYKKHRIFDDKAEQLFPKFLNLGEDLSWKVIKFIWSQLVAVLQAEALGIVCLRLIAVLFCPVVCLLPLLMLDIVVILYGRGPLVCIALSLWRIAKHDYGVSGGDQDKANLTPALDVFYSLVLCQGRCLKDPTSINGRRVIHYAISLLDSESWEDNLSGLRMLDASIHR
uniref:DUF4220 domain-containing protein n=1 Tax=Setaria italica TaxID=4555 RepID=K3ZNP9_SETIT